MHIQLERCLLRPLVPGDAPSLAMHANDRDVWLNLRDLFPHPYTLANAESYIGRVAVQTVPTSFGIVVDGLAVGNISLKAGTDIERNSAELGYWLGRAFWGRGIVSDAVRGMTLHAFDHLHLNRVFAVPFKRNPASSRVLEKVGFTLEGVMRRSAIKDGVIEDQLLYAAYDDTRLNAAR
jgi:RimJ/RimL family protein N-acetyltransferase